MVPQYPTQQPGVNLPDCQKDGVFSNSVVVTHTRGEFVIDFMMIKSPTVSVTSRVTISPGHMKRIVAELHDDVVKYQEKFGKITAVADPVKEK